MTYQLTKTAKLAIRDYLLEANIKAFIEDIDELNVAAMELGFGVVSEAIEAYVHDIRETLTPYEIPSEFIESGETPELELNITRIEITAESKKVEGVRWDQFWGCYEVDEATDLPLDSTVSLFAVLRAVQDGNADLLMSSATRLAKVVAKKNLPSIADAVEAYEGHLQAYGDKLA